MFKTHTYTKITLHDICHICSAVGWTILLYCHISPSINNVRNILVRSVLVLLILVLCWISGSQGHGHTQVLSDDFLTHAGLGLWLLLFPRLVLPSVSSFLPEVSPTFPNNHLRLTATLVSLQSPKAAAFQLRNKHGWLPSGIVKGCHFLAPYS